MDIDKHKSKVLLAWDGYFGLSQMTWNLIFAFLVVFGQVGQNVTLPIWFSSIPNGKVDPLFILSFSGLMFVIIFLLFTLNDLYITKKTTMEELLYFAQYKYIKKYCVIGVSNGLNGILLVYAARVTAPYLQAILSTFQIFWTILFRGLILKKFPSLKQSFHAVNIFVGLFLASIPSIFGLNENGAFQTDANGVWKILFPVIFMISFAPAAVMNVAGEDVLKEIVQEEHSHGGRRKSNISINEYHSQESDEINRFKNGQNLNVWYYLFMQSLAQELTFVLLFWLDAVPTFGYASNVSSIFSNLKQDWRYFFGLDGASVECPIRALIFVACYTINYIGSVLMLRYTEGATWTAIISALVTPLGGIFWLLFELKLSGWFGWYPTWQSSSYYILGGLLYMAPFIYFYDKEAQNIDSNPHNINDSKSTVSLRENLNSKYDIM